MTRVVIEDADPSWPAAFDRLRAAILPTLDGLGARIEHIGSTAVPGLAAKPIIDLVIVVPDERAMTTTIDRLARLGYGHEGDLGVPGREAFSGGPSDPAHHLYATSDGSAALTAHLAFRDALRTDPGLAARYADLKRTLAHLVGHDRAAYTEGKTAFVTSVLSGWRGSRTETGWTIRIATRDDVSFLVRMLAHAAFPPWHRPWPTPAQVRAEPRTARYVAGWGRAGDGGVLALDRAGRRIGAAWYRLLTGEERGHGHLDDRTSEVVIGIGPRWRGRGIGTALMERLILLAKESGVDRLSLSVSTANPAAVRLYRRVGFAAVGGDDRHLLMLWTAG